MIEGGLQRRRFEELLRRAHASYDADRPAAALLCVSRALRIYRTSAQALVLKGKILVQLDRVGEALKAFTEAISADARSPDAFCERGRVLFAVRKHNRRALRDVNTALRLARGRRSLRADALRLRGHIVDALGDHAAAIAAYRASLRAVRTDYQTYEALGDTLLLVGRPRLALRAFDVAVSVLSRRQDATDQDVGLLLIAKAEALSELKDHLGALRTVEAAYQRVKDPQTRAIVDAARKRFLSDVRKHARLMTGGRGNRLATKFTKKGKHGPVFRSRT